MYKFPPKNTKPKTGFGFAKLAGFTGFPVLAKTGFHSLIYTSIVHGENYY